MSKYPTLEMTSLENKIVIKCDDKKISKCSYVNFILYD